jgi:hypothetical protein
MTIKSNKIAYKEKFGSAYHRNRRMELRTEIAFLATNGEMVSSVSGKPLIICNDQNKTVDCATYHHVLQLNGNRPNGVNARLSEMRANYWNISMMTIGEHRDFHFKNGQEFVDNKR